MRALNFGTFYGAGTNTASATIPAQSSGLVRVMRIGWDSPGAGTLVIYRARELAKANAAVSADTTLVVKTDASGYVGGAVLTTNDYVLVSNPTTGAYVLSQISAVAAVSSSTVSLTLGTAITCSANQTIWIIRAADILTLTTAAESVRDLYDFVIGYQGYPIHFVLAATGTCRVNGAYSVLEQGGCGCG